MIKKILEFTIDETGDSEYDFECANKGVKLNGSIYEALDEIRSRLKYGEDVTEVERTTLEQLRITLSEYYVEG
ncbi:MAG: hypothetical protein HC836_45575 [Richelia sp. RM2_1_2]|nr:hypothetical protein [Richelia sp. RM2_1_2]